MKNVYYASSGTWNLSDSSRPISVTSVVATTLSLTLYAELTRSSQHLTTLPFGTTSKRTKSCSHLSTTVSRGSTRRRCSHREATVVLTMTSLLTRPDFSLRINSGGNPSKICTVYRTRGGALHPVWLQANLCGLGFTKIATNEHGSPPSVAFALLRQRFEHMHIDLVGLIIDRFTR